MNSKIQIKAAVCMLLLFFALSAEKLYVYYPSPLRPNVVQRMIDGKSGSVAVTVFGKYRDFVMKVQMDSPEAVMTMEGTIKELTGYTKKLSAARGGATSEEYVLLSVGAPVAPGDLDATAIIGVVDFMRRNSMNSFVEKFVGVKTKVKHVTKIDDLLPLISFNMAKAVLIPKDKVAYFKSKSNLDFKVTPLTNKGSIAQVATKVDSPAILDAAKAVNKAVPNYIGGIVWK